MTALQASPPASTRAPSPRMTLWRLEWLRLVRTPRVIALAAVYLLLGLGEPVLTKYENTLLGGHLGHGVRIYVPPPVPGAALDGYVKEASLVGLILVVVLAAGALSFDARPGLAAFLRTRTTSMWRLVGPRFAVGAGAAVAAYLLGTLGAWYETDLLIGSLPVGGMAAGMLCGGVYLCFASAVTVLGASVTRNALATAGITLAALLVLGIGSGFDAVAAWLPSTLAGAPVDLVDGTHGIGHYLPTLAVTAVAGTAALVVAVRRLRRREI